MKTAAAYVRVSTEKQDEYSLDSQLKLIREYAAQHDMIVPNEFVFVEDGVSGRYAKKRRAFQRTHGALKSIKGKFFRGGNRRACQWAFLPAPSYRGHAP